VALEREHIERRDFPTARRGYDPAAVDAHLRAVAAQVQELVQRTGGAGEPALGPAAATQVQGILDAAQATAAEIEREARRDAQRIRAEAAQDAERAREHVQTLARVSTALRERVQTLDGEVGALAESLRVREGALPPAPAPTAPPAPAPPAPAPPAPVGLRGGNDLDGARLVVLNMALGGESREQADRYLADSFQPADRAKLLDEVYAAVEG
jgi:DivIVA domain-containing protein